MHTFGAGSVLFVVEPSQSVKCTEHGLCGGPVDTGHPDRELCSSRCSPTVELTVATFFASTTSIHLPQISTQGIAGGLTNHYLGHGSNSNHAQTAGCIRCSKQSVPSYVALLSLCTEPPTKSKGVRQT